LILVLLLCLFACQGDRYGNIRNLTSQGTTVVCFGDSLTEGIGAENGGDYPSLLARQLPYRIVNAGRRGDTSADALSRLDREVLAHDPRLVVVFLGGNDFLRRIPVTETRQNLSEIVRRIQQQGAMVALAGMRLGLFTDEYGSVYRDIAEGQGALLVPEVLKGILSDPQLRSDPIHPNAAGYRLLATRISDAVKPLLAEADRNRQK
jgi:acyl-CoA thioesterase-1